MSKKYESKVVQLGNRLTYPAIVIGFTALYTMLNLFIMVWIRDNAIQYGTVNFGVSPASFLIPINIGIVDWWQIMYIAVSGFATVCVILTDRREED